MFDGEGSMSIEIRLARAEDAREICKIHAYSWYTTYINLLPIQLLEEKIKNYDTRIPMMELLCKSANLYVLTFHQKIIGMIEIGESRDANFASCGEIYALYLLKEYHGNGYGKQLFLFGIKELLQRGYKDIILNVLEGNKTIYFYEKLGGKIVGERIDVYQNILLKEKIMYFENIEYLLK